MKLLVRKKISRTRLCGGRAHNQLQYFFLKIIPFSIEDTRYKCFTTRTEKHTQLNPSIFQWCFHVYFFYVYCVCYISLCESKLQFSITFATMAYLVQGLHAKLETQNYCQNILLHFAWGCYKLWRIQHCWIIFHSYSRSFFTHRYAKEPHPYMLLNHKLLDLNSSQFGVLTSYNHC